ncbi:Fic family protein [Jejubacter calystegiae]|uniref:Fic family protein n=1 Tax=Jejubacter calystegiae TaxID=2579935 RepID=A0A4P8YFL3_9ENTR|nr:Fic family protein [Jejubacter calystegiae]
MLIYIYCELLLCSACVAGSVKDLSGGLKSMTRPELVSYLAECHVEFILIHPFREGNGRLSRLLCDALSVMAGQWRSTGRSARSGRQSTEYGQTSP